VLTLGWSHTPRGRLLLRRAVARVIRSALRLRSRALPRNAVTSVLVVAPHPDDEAFGCGGTVARLVRDGASAHVVFVTDGSASHPGHPSVTALDIAGRRRAEARVATGILGVDWDRVSFLDAPDGTLARLDGGHARAIEERIAGMLERLAPEVILMPCRRDGSTEHDASFALVAGALQRAKLMPRIFEFPVWSCWNPLMLLRPMITCRRIWRVDLREVRDVKARAMASYSSQTDPIPPETSPALPLGFASLFLGREEFLFET